MFVLVKSPTTGEEFFTDIGWRITGYVTKDGTYKDCTVDALQAHDSLTEGDMVDSILDTLHGYPVEDEAHLKQILMMQFGISPACCKELVKIIGESLSITQSPEVGL